MKKADSGKSSLLRILGIVLPLAGLAFLVLQQANFLVGRSLLIAFGDTETTYKSAWFEWDGDIVAKELVIYPYGTETPDATITFEKIHVETPGWFWFLRNVFDRKLRVARLDRVHLTLTGGASETGLDPSLGDLGPFGAISASPFETEGCMKDSAFTRVQLEAMGVRPDPTRLEFDYSAEGTQLTTRVTLESKRSSRVTLERREHLQERANVLLLDYVGGKVMSERWEVEDQGFVSARNRYCAKQDGIDARRFLERHVQAVERLMAIQGLAMTPDVKTAYRRFARDGGTLSFGGEYNPPIDVESIYDAHDDGTAWYRMSPRLEHNGRAYPMTWMRVQARPLPGLEDGTATFALMLQERGGALPTETVPDTGIASSAAVAAAPGTPAGSLEGTGGAVAALPAAGPVAPAEEASPRSAPEAPGTVAVAPSAPAAAAAAAAASTSAASPATSAAAPSAFTPLSRPVTNTPGGAPLASSAPENVPVPKGPRPGTPLQWGELDRYRGRLIRVWTVHNPPRTVEVLAVEDGALRVAARLGGGNAEYTIQRSGFRKATLVR